MIPNPSWLSVFVAGAVGIYLLGPTRLQIRPLSKGLAVALLATSAADLIRFGTDTLSTLWSPWAVLLALPILLLLELRPSETSDRETSDRETSDRETSDRQSSRDLLGDPAWRESLAASQDPLAVIDGEHRIQFANPPWQTGFEGRRLEILMELIAPLLEQADRHGRAEGSVDLKKLAWLERSDLLQDIEETIPLRVMVARASDAEPGQGPWMILLEGSRAKGFAVYTRRLAHNINNMLSAAVGGAGMAMELVPESSDVHRELTEIEDVAMRAAEVTSELQALAREIAPPAPLTRP